MLVPLAFPLNTILVVLLNLIGIYLAFLVYWTNRSDNVNRGFLLLIIPNLLWIDFYNLAFLSNDPNLSLLLTRLTFTSVFIFFISFYYFFIIWFLNEKGWYLFWGRLVIIYEIIFGFLCASTPLVIRSLRTGNWGITPTFSTLGSIIFHLPIIILVVLIIERLVVNYFKSPFESRKKIQYFLIGVFVFVLGNLVIGVILPFFFKVYDYYFVTNYISIIFLVLTAYAIIKHQLFNVKLLISQFLVFIIWTFVAVRIALSNSIQEMLINTALLLLVFIIGVLLLRSISKETELAIKLLEATKKSLDLEKKLRERITKKTDEMIKKMEDIVR